MSSYCVLGILAKYWVRQLWFLWFQVVRNHSLTDLSKKGNVMVDTVGSGSEVCYQLCFLSVDYFKKSSLPGYRLPQRCHGIVPRAMSPRSNAQGKNWYSLSKNSHLVSPEFILIGLTQITCHCPTLYPHPPVWGQGTVMCWLV